MNNTQEKAITFLSPGEQRKIEKISAFLSFLKDRQNLGNIVNSFVVSTFTAQKKAGRQLPEIHLVAGAGVPGYNSATA